MHVPWYHARLPDDGPEIYTSVTASEAAELGRLATGREVLEIGSAFGYSAIVMALAGAVSVTAVDPHLPCPSNEENETLVQMLANLDAYRVRGRVAVLDHRSDSMFPRLPAGHFGLVFIDADHDEDAVRADVEGALPLIAPGGWLACHDYGNDNCPGVAAVLDDMFPAGPSRLVNSLWAREMAG